MGIKNLIEINEFHAALSDAELLDQMEHIGALMDGYKAALGHLEQEAYRRMEENKATSIPSEVYICEMETSYKYCLLYTSPSPRD